MKKGKNRILAAILALTMLSGITSASAANTSDTPFDFTISGQSGTTELRDKTNSTPVYVYYTTGKYSSVRASAWGYLDTDDPDLAALPKNRTLSGNELVNYVYVKKSIKTSIHTKLWETNCWWGVHLSMRSYNASASDTVSGVWSPDSTRTYTSATN